MSPRLIIAILTSLLDEAAILAAIIWLLPKIGIKLPLWGIILCVLGFAAFAVISFRIGSHTLRKKPLAGFTDMVGTEGKTAALLNPEGLVNIEGELWSARAAEGSIESGTRVVVTKQNGLKLIVQAKT